ncbi:MAG: hypothetical protein KDE14_08125, partial [Rhodobacteraceae bacterium]|nr:hypothetical protein [Paracoccaceae bacterium]
HLLFMRSLLEDGEFAVAGMQVFEDIVKPVLAPCIAAARESGDLTGEMSADAAFRLMAQMQIIIGTFALPDRARFGDAHEDRCRVQETTCFILRGLGVRTEAIERFIEKSEDGGQDAESLRKTA